MYVVTFYSFKGGAGRTMALVNVGAELARTGARVLLVDCDLEAPSLMSFNLAGTTRSTKGLAELALEYQDTGRIPPLEEHIFESETFRDPPGQLWIMPAGFRGPDYKRKLARLDWQELYEKRDGYLFIEELKARWQDYLQPDYVLIDSRTGHNEIMGICTRQLPDAVCAVFVPNRQNLGGLADVVGQIREQRVNSEGQPIQLHFAVSNVPQVDDEQGTLETMLLRYRRVLKVPQFDATLHHHPHLALLGHDIFVLKRQHSVLSEEYRQLTDAIRAPNLSDPRSALKYLRDLNASFRGAGGSIDPGNIEERLARIATEHVNNDEVSIWLARARRQLGATAEASVLLDQIIDRGNADAHAYLERASLRLREQDRQRLSEARCDLLSALDDLGGAPNYRDVTFALRTLVSLGPDNWQELAHKPAVQKLLPREQLELARGLDTTDAECELRYHILEDLPARASLSPEDLRRWRIEFSLSCIRLNHFVQAIETLRTGNPNGLEREDAFNLGMAVWGKDGSPASQWFARVLELERSAPRGMDANYLQCLAICTWACGQPLEAARHLAQARQMRFSRGGLEFSAWRYLRVGAREFQEDLAELERLFSGTAVRPRFLRREG